MFKFKSIHSQNCIIIYRKCTKAKIDGNKLIKTRIKLFRQSKTNEEKKKLNTHLSSECVYVKFKQRQITTATIKPTIIKHKNHLQ